ncbi:MAG: hypothetical protein AAB635_00835 [Patescibacteria group bacterium]
MNKKGTKKGTKKVGMGKKGFIALFVVTIIGLMAVFFVVSTAPRAWLQAKDVTLAQVAASARFNAISCINIARLKIFLGGDSLDGEYYIENGSCEIEIISRQGERIILQTDATKEGVRISLQAELDAGTLEILSIREF